MTLEATADSIDHGTAASGSSFYAAMRILPPAQRDAMFQVYSFCREVDDVVARLRDAAHEGVDVLPLHGRLPASAQDASARAVRTGMWRVKFGIGGSIQP